MKTLKLVLAIPTALVVILSLSGPVPAQAQETTERYIPIGKSPGVSDKSSYIGTITAVDMEERTIEIDSNRGERTVEITEDTQIWIDRTATQRTNAVGSYSDCQVGRRVEVMHVRGDETVADWIKIAAP